MKKIYNCKTLLGHNGIDFSITCLKSFINNADQEVHLQIFEDGTITKEDEKKLLAEIPNGQIIYKHFRNPILNQKLKDFPRCLNYRNNSNYAQKLFDIMMKMRFSLIVIFFLLRNSGYQILEKNLHLWQIPVMLTR